MKKQIIERTILVANSETGSIEEDHLEEIKIYFDLSKGFEVFHDEHWNDDFHRIKSECGKYYGIKEIISKNIEAIDSI
jgi:hypothetical protein